MKMVTAVRWVLTLALIGAVLAAASNEAAAESVRALRHKLADRFRAMRGEDGQTV